MSAGRATVCLLLLLSVAMRPATVSAQEWPAVSHLGPPLMEPLAAGDDDTLAPDSPLLSAPRRTLVIERIEQAGGADAFRVNGQWDPTIYMTAGVPEVWRVVAIGGELEVWTKGASFQVLARRGQRLPRPREKAHLVLSHRSPLTLQVTPIEPGQFMLWLRAPLVSPGTDAMGRTAAHVVIAGAVAVCEHRPDNVRPGQSAEDRASGTRLRPSR
jgi:hypothetical protein